MRVLTLFNIKLKYLIVEMGFIIAFPRIVSCKTFKEIARLAGFQKFPPKSVYIRAAADSCINVCCYAVTHPFGKRLDSITKYINTFICQGMFVLLAEERALSYFSSSGGSDPVFTNFLCQI